MIDVLVIKLDDNTTMTHCRIDEDYGVDPAVLAAALVAEFHPTKALSACAVVDDDILKHPGTDLDVDITIVNGTVTNAKAP